jgi:hypothetical protein
MPGGMMSFEPMAANEVIGTKFWWRDKNNE